MGDNFVTPEHQLFQEGEVRCPGALLGSSCRLELPSSVTTSGQPLRQRDQPTSQETQHPQAWAPAGKGEGWNPGEMLLGTDRKQLRNKLRGDPTKHCPLWIVNYLGTQECLQHGGLGNAEEQAVMDSEEDGEEDGDENRHSYLSQHAR